MKSKLSFLLAGVALSVGCSTVERHAQVKDDPRAVERSRPYLMNHTALDVRDGTLPRACAEPKTGSDWKTWVQYAGACVQKQNWSMVEKLGTEMASREVDSPWGSYFLGVAAAGRGEMLRAHWMLDLSEKKAGGAIGLVRYEKARWLEKEDSISAAAAEMKEAVRVDPSMIPALLWLAQIYQRDRMLKEAERYHRQVLALRGDVWPALVGLADIEIENGNSTEALTLLKRAVAIKSEKSKIEKIRQLESTMKPAKADQARDREPAREKKGG